MDLIVLYFYAFLCGVCLSGFVGAGAQIIWHEAPGLRAPYISRRHLLRSIVLSVMCGPTLFIGELHQTMDLSRLGWHQHILVVIIVLCWATASGILLLETMNWLTL